MAGSTRAVGLFDLQQKDYHMNFGGRLTLTSGIPVTEADVVGVSTVYFTPRYHARSAAYRYQGPFVAVT